MLCYDCQKPYISSVLVICIFHFMSGAQILWPVFV
jgi:hypothetical protein